MSYLPKGPRVVSATGQFDKLSASKLSSGGEPFGNGGADPGDQQAEPAYEPVRRACPEGGKPPEPFGLNVSLDDLVSNEGKDSTGRGRSEASVNASGRRRRREHDRVDHDGRKRISRQIGRMPVAKGLSERPKQPLFMYQQRSIGVSPFERAMQQDLERVNSRFRLLSSVNQDPEHDVGILSWEDFCSTQHIPARFERLGLPRTWVLKPREWAQCLQERAKQSVRSNDAQLQGLQEVLTVVEKEDKKESQATGGPMAVDGVESGKGAVTSKDYRLCVGEERFKFWQNVEENPYPGFPPLHVCMLSKHYIESTTPTDGESKKDSHFPREQLLQTRTESSLELWQDIAAWEPFVRSAHITYHMSSPNAGDGGMLMGPHDPLRRAHAVVQHYWKGNLVESAGPWSYPITTHGLNAWGVSRLLGWATFGTTTAVLVELDQWVGPFREHWLPHCCLMPYMTGHMLEKLPCRKPLFRGTLSDADQFMGIDHTIQEYLDAASTIKCWPHTTGDELLGAYSNADAKHPISKDVASLFRNSGLVGSEFWMGNDPAPLYREYRRKGSLLDLEVHQEWPSRQMSAMYLPAVAGLR